MIRHARPSSPAMRRVLRMLPRMANNTSQALPPTCHRDPASSIPAATALPSRASWERSPSVGHDALARARALSHVRFAANPRAVAPNRRVRVGRLSAGIRDRVARAAAL